MATCKDCIHYNACLSILRKTFPKVSTDKVDKPNCQHFTPELYVDRVVRCIVCKHYYMGIMNRCTHPCGLKQADDFNWCCYGERKES